MCVCVCVVLFLQAQDSACGQRRAASSVVGVQSQRGTESSRRLRCTGQGLRHVKLPSQPSCH